MDENINSESTTNYVDRVRVRDTNNTFGGPGRGSGWRQKSLSNIDLSTSHRFGASGGSGHGTAGEGTGFGHFRYRDYDSGLYDLYTKTDNPQDYEDIYGVNPKASSRRKYHLTNSNINNNTNTNTNTNNNNSNNNSNNNIQISKTNKSTTKDEIIYEHTDSHYFPHNDNEACSLRRTRSLAVIREETFNDLQISGARTRRSQLIPRAKLVDRNFFRDRYNFIYDDSGSGLDTLTSETHETDSQYSTSRRNVPSSQSQTYPWQQDRSDLDSIDSSIFKHSLHQSAFEKTNSIRSETKKGDSKKASISYIEVHGNAGEPSYDTLRKQQTNLENDIKLLDEISLADERKTPSKTSTLETVIKNPGINTNTYRIKEETESGVTIIEIKDNNINKDSSKEGSSVISYDSIYLSSESSDKLTICGDIPLPDSAKKSDLSPVKANHSHSRVDTKDNGSVSAGAEKKKLIGTSNNQPHHQHQQQQQHVTRQKSSKAKPIDDNESIDTEEAEKTIDNLYSQVTKIKPKIIAVEPKKTICDTLSKYTDHTSRGTLERLSVITNLKLRPEFAIPKTTQHYNSLPDTEIGKILRASERIDNKLRKSCDSKEPHPDYGTLTHSEKLNNKKIEKKLSQKSSSESSLEECPKGAPSIELVQPPTKPIDDNNNHTISKVYLEEYGLELDYDNSVITSDQESTITVIDPPPSVSLGGKKIIVDEVAAKAVKRQDNDNPQPQQLQQTTSLLSSSSSTASACSAEEKQDELDKVEDKINSNRIKERENTNNLRNLNENSKFLDTNPFKETNPFRQLNIEQQIDKNNNSSSSSVVNKKLGEKKKDTVLRKFESRENLYSAIPTRVIPAPSAPSVAVPVTLEAPPILTSFALAAKAQPPPPPAKVRRPRQQVEAKTFEILIKEAAEKMPRPQLLQIIDSKRSSCHGQVLSRPPTLVNSTQSSRRNSGDSNKLCGKTDNNHSNEIVQQEFQHKVDSVRNYWSKILVKSDEDAPKTDGNIENNEDQVLATNKLESSAPSHYLQTNSQRANVLKYQPDGSVNDSSIGNDFQSFCPTVEIIELDGQKQAALVKAKNLDEIDFDHVRYKVMKSDMFQKNLLVNHRKEAQFDGLMQYLQDYSFQELLAHNNVVIIEPVRTKIEKISNKPLQSHSTTCKITSGALNQETAAAASAASKNDEELPSPDTVRNVCKLFEGTLRFGTNPKQSEDDSKLNRNSENLRKKTLRYLTIDTSYGNSNGIKKWDSASLSSGVSSGDLSSPCECGENYNERDTKNIFSSEENLCDEDFESHYVSPDVLEKIRECGSTVTYYGGRVVDKKFDKRNLMTKTIMKEIRGGDKKCISCQPNNCPRDDEMRLAGDGYLGMKFKLVKSNSCSSRLELAGTGKTPPDLRKRILSRNSDYSPPPVTERERPLSPEKECDEAEESVRSMITRLENGGIKQPNANRVAPPVSTAPITKPRIIESKCIEKQIQIESTTNTKSNSANNNHNELVTINNQTINELPVIAENKNEQQSIEEEEEGEEDRETPTLSSDLHQQTIDEETTLTTTTVTASTAGAVTGHVTVNNHISYSKPINNSDVLSNNNNINQINNNNANNKVCRNKNVDLAFATLNGSKSNLNKPAKDKENNSTKKTIKEINNNSDNSPNNNEVQSPVISVQAPTTPTTTITFNDLKPAQLPQDVNDNSKLVHDNLMSDLIRINEIESKNQLESPKLVNWSINGTIPCKFDEKQYIANDHKLKEKKKYDEMEFEEFEIFDPTKSECYDSLNSNK